MSHHEPCGPQEVYLGNTQRHNGMDYLGGRFKTARFGEKAFDLDGKLLPKNYAPLFIHRSEVQAYNDFMMARTFGPNWKR